MNARAYNFNSDIDKLFPNAFDPLINPNNPAREFNQFNGRNPKDMFLNHNFVNDNTILFNNLHVDLLNENIKEYTVLIDSKDRNYQIYPNPFHYDVTFDPIPTEKKKVGSKEIVYETPTPTISTGFSNVRYIKLDVAILPMYTGIRRRTINTGEKNEVGLDIFADEECIDRNKSLIDNLYNVLIIEEYKDVNYKSTNEVLSDSFSTLYYDDMINRTHFRSCPEGAIKVFPRDQLGKIDKFKIRFYDPYGCELNVPHLDPRIKSNMTCECGDTNNPNCFRHNLSHPLNPNFQNHLQFKIGVVEPTLSKKNFY